MENHVDLLSHLLKTYAKPTPPGTAKFEPIGAVRYLDDEDAFEVEFDSGETYRVTHDAIRRANRLLENGEVESVRIEAEMRSGFLVRYRKGEFAGTSRTGSAC